MSAQKPLDDVKVIELGQLIAGPFAGKIFAEFGAEVIKIEPPAADGKPGGDPLRQWRKLHNGTSLWWYAQARNKKSVTINLRLAEGQDIVRKLARDADIVIENFRPGTMEKWGLGYDRLAAENPGYEQRGTADTRSLIRSPPTTCMASMSMARWRDPTTTE